MGEERRITDLTEISAFRANDYIAVDNASEAQTKKLPASVITDEFSAIENVYGAKNLIPYPYNETTKTTNGITFTDNGDGTITVKTASDGATADTRFYFQNIADNFNIDNGSYILSDGTIGNAKLYTSIALYNNNTYTNIGYNTSNGGKIKFSLTSTPTRDRVTLYITVKSGYINTSGIVIKPMLRLASIQDDTWVPYAKTNKELTDTFKNQVANKADEYSPSKAYKVGEHCIQNNVLYKCITPCSAASWTVNQSCFEATTLTKAVTDLNNDLVWEDISSQVTEKHSSLSRLTVLKNKKFILVYGMANASGSISGNLFRLPASCRNVNSSTYVDAPNYNGSGYYTVATGYFTVSASTYAMFNFIIPITN